MYSLLNNSFIFFFFFVCTIPCYKHMFTNCRLHALRIPFSHTSALFKIECEPRFRVCRHACRRRQGMEDAQMGLSNKTDASCEKGKQHGTLRSLYPCIIHSLTKWCSTFLKFALFTIINSLETYFFESKLSNCYSIISTFSFFSSRFLFIFANNNTTNCL